MILLAKSKLHANLLVTSDILKSVQKKKTKPKQKIRLVGFCIMYSIPMDVYRHQRHSTRLKELTWGLRCP